MDSRPDRMRWMSVNNAMTKEVVTVKASSRMKDAWLLLMKVRISGAPVVDSALPTYSTR